MIKILMILMVAAFVSCGDSDALKTIEHIKSIGDEDAEQAMVMLDSIRGSMTHESEYVQMKFVLLDIRLKDKAGIMAPFQIITIMETVQVANFYPISFCCSNNYS